MHGGTTVLQHILPPSVELPRDPHVIRHHIHQLAHPMLLQRVHHRAIVFFRPDFGIQPGGVDDVIPMGAARHRREIGRTIEIRDPEIVQMIRKLQDEREDERRRLAEKIALLERGRDADLQVTRYLKLLLDNLI